MIQIKFMKPFSTKVNGSKLRLKFKYQDISIMKDNVVYYFIPIEGKEMIVDLNTLQVENLSEAFVFQRDDRNVRFPLYQLLLASNIHDHLTPIIENQINKYDSENIESKEVSDMIGAVNFKGFGETRSVYKKYYFKTNLKDLKKGAVVEVDTVKGLQKANFIEYVDEKNIDFKPTKQIIRKYEEVIILTEETHQIMDEIMEFHKQQYIDECLDNNDSDAINNI